MLKAEMQTTAGRPDDVATIIAKALRTELESRDVRVYTPEKDMTNGKDNALNVAQPLSQYATPNHIASAVMAILAKQNLRIFDNVPVCVHCGEELDSDAYREVEDISRQAANRAMDRIMKRLKMDSKPQGE
jgi:hypothetical protein